MLKQPVGQKRLTNVALIKYKVSKKNFEIACYKNKAIDWRNGIEKDLNEVLQTHAIYRKADLGEQASHEELEKFFPKMKFDDIIKTILDKGELDIGDREREEKQDLLFKDIANLIAERVVHPDNKRPFSVESIKAALKAIHFTPRLDQPPKKQASDCTKQLISKYYITRAEMEIKLMVDVALKSRILSELEQMNVKPQKVTAEKDNVSLVCLIEPSLYRALDDLIKNKLEDGTMEILTRCVTKREMADLEDAGGANLKIREVPIEEDKHESDEEPLNKKDAKKAKKDAKKAKVKEEKKAEEPNTLKQDVDTLIQEDKDEAKLNGQPLEPQISEKKFKCSACKGAGFDTNQEFRTHFKTDWHNFNNKRKIEKKEPVTEEEFLDQLLDDQFTQGR